MSVEDSQSGTGQTYVCYKQPLQIIFTLSVYHFVWHKLHLQALFSVSVFLLILSEEKKIKKMLAVQDV